MFHVFLDTPVSPAEMLKEQRRRFGQDRFSRRPEYLPGRNVRMDPNTYTLYATTPGVVSLRHSHINPAYKWVDVDPDIQKVRKSRVIRSALDRCEEASYMVSSNPHYREELKNAEEPLWRERVMREVPLWEQYEDPNRLTRGLTPSLDPLHFCSYE